MTRHLFLFYKEKLSLLNYSQQELYTQIMSNKAEIKKLTNKLLKLIPQYITVTMTTISAHFFLINENKEIV